MADDTARKNRKVLAVLGKPRINRDNEKLKGAPHCRGIDVLRMHAINFSRSAGQFEKLSRDAYHALH